jgi:hypothetical protein
VAALAANMRAVEARRTPTAFRNEDVGLIPLF